MDKDEQQKLIDGIAEALEQAHIIGVQHAQVLIGKQERKEKKHKNFFDLARLIVLGIVDRVRETISAALSKRKEARPGEEARSPEQVVQETVESEIDVLPDLVAETEVVSAVESAVLDTLKEAGTRQVVWIANPDACPTCLENEEQGPIKVGETFASGNLAPPAHPRCRCNLSTP